MKIITTGQELKRFAADVPYLPGGMTTRHAFLYFNDPASSEEKTARKSPFFDLTTIENWESIQISSRFTEVEKYNTYLFPLAGVFKAWRNWKKTSTFSVTVDPAYRGQIIELINAVGGQVRVNT